MKRLQLYRPRKWSPKPWKITEVRELRRIVVMHNFTASQVAQKEQFHDRSINSIAQQMRRNRLVLKRAERQKLVAIRGGVLPTAT